MAKISWLHISDLHIFKRSKTSTIERQRQELALKSMIRFLQKNDWEDIMKPQYIFITGDLAFAGSKEDYSDKNNYSVSKFLKELTLTLKISSGKVDDHVFMVVGNHEAERKKLSEDYEKVHLDLAKEQDKLSETFLQNSEVCKNVLKRFAEYHKFCKSFYLNCPDDIRELLWYKKTIKLDSKKIHIVGLCSAFLCQSQWFVQKMKDNDSEGIEHLRLCEGIVNNYFKNIDENDFVICLMHHDYTRTADSVGKIRGTLESKCDLILMGHDHKEDWAEAIGGKCHRIHAGSLYENINHRNAFNIAELNTDTGDVKMKTVHLRPDKDSYEWSVDKEADPAGGKIHPFYRFDTTTGLLTYTLKKLRTPIIKDDFLTPMKSIRLRYGEPADFKSIISLASYYLGEGHSLTLDAASLWYKKNTKMLRIIECNDHYQKNQPWMFCGYCSILPLVYSTYHLLKEGKIQDFEITKESLLPFRSPELHNLYIMDIMTSRKTCKEYGCGKLPGSFLIEDIIRYVLYILKKNPNIKSICTLTASNEGKRLAKRFGLVRDKKYHNVLGWEWWERDIVSILNSKENDHFIRFAERTPFKTVVTI